MRKDTSPVGKFVRFQIAEVMKRIRLLTKVVNDRNMILDDWRHGLRHIPYSCQMPEYAEKTSVLVENTRKAIIEFVDRQTSSLEDSLDRELVAENLERKIINLIQIESSQLIAKSIVCNMGKVLKAAMAIGVTAGVIALAFKICKNGENGKAAIERAQEQLKKDQ